MPKKEPFDEHTGQYEEWFKRNEAAYQSELNAVRTLLPSSGEGIEIGTGTGRFSEPFGIEFGIEPSENMRYIAIRKGIKVVDGVGEDIPFEDCRFDFALMVTTICFLDDIDRAFQEVSRILKPGGAFIIGFVDRESLLGRIYETHKAENVFYRCATFYSTEEVHDALQRNGFSDFSLVQTIFHKLNEITETEPVEPGFGQGSFIVIKALKK